MFEQIPPEVWGLLAAVLTGAGGWLTERVRRYQKLRTLEVEHEAQLSQAKTQLRDAHATIELEKQRRSLESQKHDETIILKLVSLQEEHYTAGAKRDAQIADTLDAIHRRMLAGEKTMTSFFEVVQGFKNQIDANTGVITRHSTEQHEQTRATSNESHAETRRLFLEHFAPMREQMDKFISEFDDKKGLMLRKVFTEALDEMVTIANGELRVAVAGDARESKETTRDAMASTTQGKPTEPLRHPPPTQK